MDHHGRVHRGRVVRVLLRGWRQRLAVGFYLVVVTGVVLALALASEPVD